MTHITYRLTAKNRDQLQNPTLGNRVWAAFFTTSIVVVRTYPSLEPLTEPHRLVVCLHCAVTTTTIATTTTCIVVVVVRTYPSLETLTEPHRLVACLHCTVSVARSMLAGGRWYPEGRLHVIPLMTVSLPGIDPNDIRKSLVC